MVKEVSQYVAECDICGKIEPAWPSDPYFEDSWDVPAGWIRSEANCKFCICPKCAAKLGFKEEKE